MEQAWLDSLSEDWVSQPRSSGSPEPSLPSLSNSTSAVAISRVSDSRIALNDPQKQPWKTNDISINSPLSERSLNEHNIPFSLRGARRPSRMKTEISHNTSERRRSRTFSASTAPSVQYHTIQHKSLSLSPKKGNYETPEWKRRLLRGDVAYGEQRDLFSPAGLESIFHPPTKKDSPLKITDFDAAEESVALPSSPPPYNIGSDATEITISAQKVAADRNQRRSNPRVMKYKLLDDSMSEFSSNDLSKSSHFRPLSATMSKEQTQEVDSDLGMSYDLSSIQHHDCVNGIARAISGQSDFFNEELSPISVSRHGTVTGKVGYAPLDLPAVIKVKQEESLVQITGDACDTSQGLRGDVTAETEDYAHNGHFVNVRRGSYSHEDSFQRRMLSPSSLPPIDESAMLPEESLQASTPKQLPGIKKTRSSIEYGIQPSPNPSSSTSDSSSAKAEVQEHKSSSGSPLKLFGTYDTFTNQKLLRRLSQFESSDKPNGEEGASSLAASSHNEVDEAFVAASSPARAQQKHKSSGRFKSFGEGDLDGFQFSEEVSHDSSRSFTQDCDKENVLPPVLDPTLQARFRFQLEAPKALEESFIEHHAKNSTAPRITKQISTFSAETYVDNSEASSLVLASQRVEDLATPRKSNGDSESKRLPKSPLKDPTPKRRRTLHKPDISHGHTRRNVGEIESLRETHQQMQYVIGKKRKDARHDDDLQAANPNVLAMRQILRPRTASQRAISHEQKPLADLIPSSLRQAKLTQEQKIAKIQAELDSIDGDMISKALLASQKMHDESRKGSVTTQDFLDEAKKIMAGIRGKARSRSGLASVEESESENDRNKSTETANQEEELDNSYQESTREPFSRPPSRAGPPLSRLPVAQHDPEILDHLRKYQEVSDMDDVIASSIKSIAMAKEAANTAREIDRMTDETISRSYDRPLVHGEITDSEPPNVRITENPELQRKRKHSTSSNPSVSDGHNQTDFPSHGSNGSSNQSTACSIPTGSSRGSDSRRVIAPHTVSHLIPEQLAGMVFNRETNIWIKRKTIVSENGEKIERNVLPSDEADEDPFGDIPDLSVDETQELQRIRAVAARQKEDALKAETSSSQSQRNVSKDATITQSESVIANGAHLPPSESSNFSHFMSSNAARQPSTRMTSWNDEQGPTAKPSTKAASGIIRRTQEYERTEIQEKIIEEEVEEQVEREISINEDRVGPEKGYRRRNVTISFSSPLASVIEPTIYDEQNSFGGGESQGEDSDQDDGGYSSGSVVITTRSTKDSVSSAKLRSALRSSSRPLSLRGHMFSTRPVSRIDERDEEPSWEQGEEDQRSISILVTRSAELRQARGVILATPRPSHEIGTLTLTPLSDFTVRQADESFGLDVSYIAQNRDHSAGQLAKRTLSRSIKELVEKLTEVEPFEPFWEHMQQIDLQDKSLNSLHKLDEFCEKLEELDVSQNQISQLNGAPCTLRHLRITHNYLSDLTAWGHLINLQYVDCSNNEIESLSAFRCLVHLRGLRADNNKIKSLDGICHLDGLLDLRLRGNLIQTIDFKNTKLQRLTNLDLGGNQIGDVRNLHGLRSLSTLNLENNHFHTFPSEKPEMHWALKYLKLSGNNLECVDVSRYPNLRLLYLDRNRLGRVTGLLKTKYLDSLSLREQQDGASLDPAFLSEAFEVRKLFLSGNLLTTFEPRVDFLNLQYLELANCGLESLPAEFGQLVSNTRVLNLNFNALRDIKALLGIVRLKKLHLAGNRLTRLRRTTNVLAQFPNLNLADLRGNPLTLGFYSPVTETQVIVRDQNGNGETNMPEPFTLARADRLKDGKYASRLDMETRMLRRVYELLLLGGCPYLRVLDGLHVDRSLPEIRDAVWEALRRADVLYGGEQTGAGNSVQSAEAKGDSTPKPDTSAPVIAEPRWAAEDSFA